MIHILTYHFVDDYINTRTPYRMKHFNHLKPYIDRKELLLGGATEADSPEGILIFDKLSKEEIKSFADSDPYIVNKVATSYNVVKWNAVAGSLIDHLSTNNI